MSQEDIQALKARLFDAEEAAKLAQANFNHLVGFLMEKLEFEAATVDEFVEKLQIALEKKDVEEASEEVEE